MGWVISGRNSSAACLRCFDEHYGQVRQGERPLVLEYLSVRGTNLDGMSRHYVDAPEPFGDLSQGLALLVTLL
jgi:hypothetical protein